jgi:hypothetical protein
MPLVKPGLILPPVSFGRVAFGAQAASSIDDELVIIQATDGLQVEHADFDVPTDHSDSVREASRGRAFFHSPAKRADRALISFQLRRIHSPICNTGGLFGPLGLGRSP